MSAPFGDNQQCRTTLTGANERSETALKHLSELRPAPSVGLQDVPRESVGEHLGFSSQEQKKTDDLDERLARGFFFPVYCEADFTH